MGYTVTHVVILVDSILRAILRRKLNWSNLYYVEGILQIRLIWGLPKGYT